MLTIVLCMMKKEMSFKSILEKHIVNRSEELTLIFQVCIMIDFNMKEKTFN